LRHQAHGFDESVDGIFTHAAPLTALFASFNME
jgi:hypothetical protein